MQHDTHLASVSKTDMIAPDTIRSRIGSLVEVTAKLGEVAERISSNVYGPEPEAPSDPTRANNDNVADTLSVLERNVARLEVRLGSIHRAI